MLTSVVKRIYVAQKENKPLGPVSKAQISLTFTQWLNYMIDKLSIKKSLLHSKCVI